MAESASAAVYAVEVVDVACASAGWDAGPFELADKLGAAAVHALLAEFVAICERQGRHIGKGLRVASRVMQQMCNSSCSCKGFWVWSKHGKKTSVNSSVGRIIMTAMIQFNFPPLPLAAWTPHSIHLQILMSATALVLPMLVFAYTGLAASLLWSYCSIQVNYLFCVAVCGWGCSRCSTRTTTSGGCAVATQCTSMQSLIAHTTTQTYALAFCDFTCAGVHSSLSLLALALPVLVPLIPPLAGDSCNGLGGGARHSLF